MPRAMQVRLSALPVEEKKEKKKVVEIKTELPVEPKKVLEPVTEKKTVVKKTKINK